MLCHFRRGACTLGYHFVYSTIQTLGVSSVTSTGINSSHSEHIQRHWWPPQMHPRREHRLHFPPPRVTYTDKEASARDVALLSLISVKILSFPFPLLLVAPGSRHGETKNLCQTPSLNWIQRCYRLCPSPILNEKNPKSAPLKNWS